LKSTDTSGFPIQDANDWQQIALASGGGGFSGTASKTITVTLTRVGEFVGGVSFADFTEIQLFSDTYQVAFATATCSGQCGPVARDGGNSNNNNNNGGNSNTDTVDTTANVAQSTAQDENSNNNNNNGGTSNIDTVDTKTTVSQTSTAETTTTDAQTTTQEVTTTDAQTTKDSAAISNLFSFALGALIALLA
jgi:hypothetical protein